jgi:stress-induced morphogen
MAESSSVTEASLKATLVEKLEATHVEIEDMSGMPPIPPSLPFPLLLPHNPQLTLAFLGGCGQAFSALIVSPQFLKKTTLARHRLVNSALKTEIAAIHAWTPKCLTPEEWEKTRTDKGGEGVVVPGKGTNGEVVVGTRD